MNTLTDRYIIKGCHSLNNSKFMTFVSDQSKPDLEKFLADDGTSGNIPDARIDIVHDLWKKLLSDAITYLKLTDEREHRRGQAPIRDVVAFGVQELYKYFEEYRSFEALLYGADRFYRDHVMHVFRVWLIGVWIMEQFGRDIYWDYDKALSIELEDDEVAAMWCIVALTHDLGYPLDKVEKVQEKISSMMRYFGGSGTLERGFQIPVQHHFINDFILRFIGSKLVKKLPKDAEEGRGFGTAIQSKYYLKFSKSLERFDHGIISCILLMKNLVYFLESDLDLGSQFSKDDARQFYIRREILRAVACHTCTDIYHLQPNSLAFILILADELQVWGRPTFREIKSGRHRLILETGIPMIGLNKIGISLHIKEERTPGGEQDAGVNYVKSIYRKWHLWLRSALDAGSRAFDFCFEAVLEPENGNSVTYTFESKPRKGVKIYEDGLEKSLNEFLYS